MINIRINPELRALIDWGCSLRHEVDIPWITRAALRKHARNDVVIDDHAALTTGTGQPVSFPDLPEDMLPAEFRVILASYLVSEHSKHQNSPYNFDAAELETENVILEVTR